MARSCTVNDARTKRAKEYFGENNFRVVSEKGMGGFNFEIKSPFGNKIVNSQLFQDILNDDRLSHLNLEELAEKAFDIYLDSFSDSFVEEYGDWANNSSKFKGARYATGEPKINKVFPKEKKDLTEEASDKAISFLEGTVSELERKIEVLERKATTEEAEGEVKRLRDLKKSLEKSLEKNQMILGVRAYLEEYLLNKEIPKLIRTIDDIKSGEKDITDRNIIWMEDFVNLHKPNIQRLQIALTNSPELQVEYEKTLKTIIESVERDLNIIEGYASSYAEDSVLDTTYKLFNQGDKEKFSKEEVKGWYENTIKGIGGLSRWFGIRTTASDPIIRMVAEMIYKINYKVANIVNPASDKLIDLQMDLNKAGFKDMSIFNEKYKGKRTGFLINKYKWGEVYTAQEELYGKAIKIYGLEDYSQVIEYNSNLSDNAKKSDDKYKKFKKLHEEFNDKYTLHGRLNAPVNEEFNKLMKNKAFSNYYNALYDIHTKAKGRLTSKFQTGIHKYMLPQIRNNELEVLQNQGVKAAAKVAGRKIKETFKTTEDDLEFGDIARDKNDKILKVVPIHYVSKISNQENLSNDITGMYHSFYTMSENFRQMTENVDTLELIYRAMGKRKIETKQSTAAVEDLLKTQVYGQALKDITVDILGEKVNVSKILDKALVKYPASVNMFLNMPVTISGAAKAEIDKYMEIMAGKFMTSKSVLQSRVEYTKNIHKSLKEVGNRKKTNKFDLMLKYLQVDDVLHKAYRSLNIDSKALRQAHSDFAYVTMMPHAYSLAVKNALGVMYNYRLIDGKFVIEYDLRKEYKRKSEVTSNKEFKTTKEYKEFKNKWNSAKGKSLYEAYEIKDNQFVVKDEYRKYISKDLEYKTSKIIRNLTDQMEGKRSSLDKASIDMHPLGKAVMLHRGWIPKLASQRFKSKGFEFALDEETEGFYRTTSRLLTNMFKITDGNIKFKLAKWEQLEDFERRNVVRFMTDLTALMVISIMATVLNNIAEDDDEDAWAIEYAAYQINRLLLEQKAMTPIPFVGGGLNEIFNIFKSPMAGANQWEKITNIGNLLINMQDDIQSGPYKGMTKWQRFIIQQGHLKNLYEIQFPKSKNSYLKSQIL